MPCFYLNPEKDEFNQIPELQVCLAEALYDIESILADPGAFKAEEITTLRDQIVSNLERAWEITATIDVAAAKDLFDRGVPSVDVCGSSYSNGHISRAVRLNLATAFDEPELAEAVKKDQEGVIFCSGSTRNHSFTACSIAVSWSFKKVHYFRDGYPGWKAAGCRVDA